MYYVLVIPIAKKFLIVVVLICKGFEFLLKFPAILHNYFIM